MNLETLIEVKEAQRDSQWEEQFFRALSESNLQILSADPVQGPDSWPYLMVQTPSSSAPSNEGVIDSAQKLLHWLSLRGIGLVVNPQKEYPDYVFSYGMIWSFRETGYFRRLDQKVTDGHYEMDRTQAKLGSPSEQFLPKYVRKIMREFLRDQGLLSPKIVAALHSNGLGELIFSIESIGNPTASEQAGVAEALSWFLPPHYPVVLMPEKSIPHFEAL